MDDAVRCKAKAKQTGQRCKNKAVPGKSVCRIHGGAPGSGRPPTHGRYSIKARQSLQSKMERFYNDPQPGDLRDELAFQRALLQELMERYPDGVNLPAHEMRVMYDMVDGIGKTVERIAKVLATTALTQAELQLLQVALIDAITEFVPDPDRQRLFVSRVFGTVGRSVGTNSTALLDGG